MKSKKLTHDTVLRKSTEVLSRQNFDKTVAVMHLDVDEYFFTIDGVAAEVWTLINGSRSIGEIKSTIKNKYNVSESKLDKDITEFISNLQKENLLKA